MLKIMQGSRLIMSRINKKRGEKGTSPNPDFVPFFRDKIR